MKRIISIFLLMCILTAALVSCGNNSSTPEPDPIPEKTPEEKVEDLISSIDDADSCYEAAKAYYALPAETRKTLRNWSDLSYAFDQYSSDTRIRDYNMQWEAEGEFNDFHNSLRNKLLNINSYTVNNEISKVYFDANTNRYYLYIKVDYSAQNQLGGYVRYENNANYFVWEGNYWRELRASFSENGEMDIIKNIYTWQYPEYKNFNFRYSAQ